MKIETERLPASILPPGFHDEIHKRLGKLDEDEWCVIPIDDVADGHRIRQMITASMRTRGMTIVTRVRDGKLYVRPRNNTQALETR